MLPPAERPRARHRAPEQARRAAEEPPVDDPELDSYLAALSGANEEHPTELTGRFGHAQVFQLRLPALRIEQLRRIAAERGVSPGSLAVDWVIDRLDREDTPTGPLPVVEDDQPKRRGLRKLGRR
jgi:aryl-alcohol dehydrogenase-like predicted oxidoreductase